MSHMEQGMGIGPSAGVEQLRLTGFVLPTGFMCPCPWLAGRGPSQSPWRASAGALSTAPDAGVWQGLGCWEAQMLSEMVTTGLVALGSG